MHPASARPRRDAMRGEIRRNEIQVCMGGIDTGWRYATILGISFAYVSCFVFRTSIASMFCSSHFLSRINLVICAVWQSKDWGLGLEKRPVFGM
jgi:hypothetical protein